MGAKRLVFMDTETTGLSANIHEIIEIAYLHLDPLTLDEIGRFEAKVKPMHIETADERALSINGFSTTAWANSKPFSNVAETIMNITGDGTIICGHNIAFDIQFIDAALMDNGYDGLKYDGIIDTQTVAKKLKIASTSMKLGALCQKYGINRDGAHTALPDVVSNVELFKVFKNQHNFSLRDVITPGQVRRGKARTAKAAIA